MAIRAGEEGILMGALVKSGLVLKVRVKSVRKNSGWRVESGVSQTQLHWWGWRTKQGEGVQVMGVEKDS